MRSFGATLDAAIEANVQTVCHLVTLTTKAGDVYRWAEWDLDLIVGANTYSACPGLTIASIPAAASADATRVDVDFMAVDGVTGLIGPDEIWDKVLDGAAVTIDVVDHALLVKGTAPIFVGTVGAVLPVTEDGKVSLECIGPLGKSLALVVDPYQPYCRWQLGDANCGVDIEALAMAGTVTDASSDSIEVSGLSPDAGATYINGLIVPTSGRALGQAWEIRTFAAGTGVIETFIPIRPRIEVGDTVSIKPGCDFTPDEETGCQKYANMARYGGFPHVPGQDAMNIQSGGSF